jgi:site-specific DNA-adenine methylase
MAKNYGMPYKGSKNSIANWVLSNLPQADTLYDLFGGGGAITHAALESGKYNKVVYNELNKNIAQMFCNAVHGLYNDRTEWVSREDFKALKDIDPFIATIWSFGNNLTGYMYSEDREPWKKALHYAIVFEDYRYLREFGINITLMGTDSHARRLEARKLINENKKEYKDKYAEWYMREVLRIDDKRRIKLIEQGKDKIKRDKAEEKARLQKILRDALKESGLKASDINKLTNTDGMASHWFGNSQWECPTEDMYNIIRTKLTTLPEDYKLLVGYYNQLCSSLGRLQSLESLESLERLQSLESQGTNLTIYAEDYRAIPITSNSVIYCDIPYKNTDAYVNQQFDYKAFYDWCCKQEVPVYISEYTLDDDRFEVVAEKEKRVLYSQTNNSSTKTEKIFKVKGR